MTFPRSHRASLVAVRPLAALLALGVVLASVPARADTPCASDSDCSKGFSCQTFNEACSSAAPPTACSPGDVCDAAPSTPPACNGAGQQFCEPGPCTTDADCADGMACHSTSSESCGTPGCADPSQGCSTAVTCTNVAGPSLCVPKYELPCTADADCGAHFKCTPDVDGVCEGSVSADGGSPTLVCTSTPTGTSSCVPDTIDCNSDGDCPATWSCVGGGTVEGCPSVIETVDGAATPTPCVIPPPAPPTCVPPSYGGGSASGSSRSSSTSSHGSSSDSGTSSSNQGSGASTTGQSGAAPTAPGSTASDATPPDSAGGCGVGGTAGGAAGWFFAAAMAFGLVRRRRATVPAERV